MNHKEIKQKLLIDDVDVELGLNSTVLLIAFNDRDTQVAYFTKKELLQFITYLTELHETMME